MLRPTLAATALLLACAASRAGDASAEPKIAEFKARAGNITAAAISSDGRQVLTGEDDGLVTLWTIGDDEAVRKYMGHGHGVFAAALLPDGKRGVTCGDDNTVIVWELATGKRLYELRTDDSIPWVMACTRDGSLAATGCNDGQVMIWELSTGKRLTSLHRRASLCSVAFSPDASLLAAGYSDGVIALWDASNWSERRELAHDSPASVGALAFSPDGTRLAAGDQEGAGFVWNTADGREVARFAGRASAEAAPSPPAAPVFPGSVVTPENCNAIVYLCFNGDGSMLLGGLQDNLPRIWDARSGKYLGNAPGFDDTRFYIARYGFAFASAAVAPARDRIVTMKENLAQVWRAQWTPQD